jgi:hypothetical protein
MAQSEDASKYIQRKKKEGFKFRDVPFPKSIYCHFEKKM